MLMDIPVFLNGEMKYYQLFTEEGEALNEEVDFLHVGRFEAYLYPHPETMTLPKYIKGIKKVTNKGLVLPPKIAPIQAVIVPILFEKTKQKVLKAAEDIKKKLQDYRVELDAREEYTPGWKFNEWELKGVPVRIEIGPKDLLNKKAVLVRRDTGKKQEVSLAGIDKKIKSVLEDIQNNLYNQSKKFFESSIVKVKKFQEFLKRFVSDRMGSCFSESSRSVTKVSCAFTSVAE